MYLGDKTTDGKLSGLDVDTLLNNLDLGDYSLSGLGSLSQGRNPADTITETTSPMSFDFSGDSGRDIHVKTVVTIENTTSSSVSETVTVSLYDGTDTTGTLLEEESKSATVSATTTTTFTFISREHKLDNGTYHVEITQSGTTLNVTQTDEHTQGGKYTIGQTNTGDFYLRDQDGVDKVVIDPVGPVKLRDNTAIKGDLNFPGTGFKVVRDTANNELSVFDQGQSVEQLRFNYNGGPIESNVNLDMGSSSQITSNASEYGDGLIDANLDSSTSSGDWFHVIEFDDAGTADDIAWARQASKGWAWYVHNQTDGNTLAYVRDGGQLVIPAGGAKITNTLTIDSTEAGGPIADDFSATSTKKNRVNFIEDASSNDPGYIVHETSESSTDSNKGVIHLAPTDDNNHGDYVSIHGTNDADQLKLHTDGSIEGVTSISGFALDGTIDGIALENLSNPALRAVMDSATGGEQWVDMARLNDASGDDYRWHANVNNNEPLLVYNHSNSTRMLEVRDGGVDSNVGLYDNGTRVATQNDVTAEVIHSADFEDGTAQGWTFNLIDNDSETGVSTNSRGVGSYCIQIGGDDRADSPSFDATQYRTIEVYFYHENWSMDASDENGHILWYDSSDSAWRKVHEIHNTSGFYRYAIHPEWYGPNSRVQLDQVGSSGIHSNGNGGGDHSIIDNITVVGYR